MVFNSEEDGATSGLAKLLDAGSFSDTQGHQAATHDIENEPADNGRVLRLEL